MRMERARPYSVTRSSVAAGILLTAVLLASCGTQSSTQASKSVGPSLRPDSPPVLPSAVGGQPRLEWGLGELGGNLRPNGATDTTDPCCRGSRYGEQHPGATYLLVVFRASAWNSTPSGQPLDSLFDEREPAAQAKTDTADFRCAGPGPIDDVGEDVVACYWSDAHFIGWLTAYDPVDPETLLGVAMDTQPEVSRINGVSD